MARIDTHAHLIPPQYRDALRKAGIDEAGGRALPQWSPELALAAMAELDVTTAILSVSTPGTTFLPRVADAAGSPATSTTGMARRWSPANQTGSGSSPPCPCPMSKRPPPRRSAHLDELRADGWCCWRTAQASTSARTARRSCSPPSTRAARWRSSTPPTCPARRSTVPPFAGRLPARHPQVSAGAPGFGASTRRVHPQPRRWVRAVRPHRMAVAIMARPRPTASRTSRVAVLQRGGVADAVGVRRTGPHHVRLGLPFAVAGQALRGRAGDLRLDAADRAIERSNALRLFPRLGSAPRSRRRRCRSGGRGASGHARCRPA